jgi:hypothetical protein
MDNPNIRRIGGLIAAVAGAVLLSVAADKSSGAGTAIVTLLLGLGLLVGGLSAIAASFGLLMNFSFVYAGTVSTNPMIIIFGWRVAGWWGLDRWLLRWLGTPWDPGEMFERGDRPVASPPPSA